MVIKVKMLRHTATVPVYKTNDAAAADLYADFGNVRSSVIIAPHETRLIPTGVAMSIPSGYVGLVVPRSGVSLKTKLRQPNGVGVIDADYRGEIHGMFENTSNEQFEMPHGYRFAQILFVPVAKLSFVKTQVLDDTGRGAGGFGSTGVE